MADTPLDAHLDTVCLFSTQVQYLVIVFPPHVSLNLKGESTHEDDVGDVGVGDVGVGAVTGDAVYPVS
jgi:hypothetical protein